MATKASNKRVSVSIVVSIRWLRYQICLLCSDGLTSLCSSLRNIRQYKSLLLLTSQRTHQRTTSLSGTTSSKGLQRPLTSVHTPDGSLSNSFRWTIYGLLPCEP